MLPNFSDKRGGYAVCTSFCNRQFSSFCSKNQNLPVILAAVNHMCARALPILQFLWMRQRWFCGPRKHVNWWS